MRLGGLIWIVLATTLAGIALMVIVAVPQLSDQAMNLIPMACAGAALIAIPLSMMIARSIRAQSRG